MKIRLFRSKSKRSTSHQCGKANYHDKCVRWNDNYLGKGNPFSPDLDFERADSILETPASEIQTVDCGVVLPGKDARRRRLRSQSGFYVAILPNGKIIGTRNKMNLFTEIDVIPFGSNLVKIWGVQAGLFLMIDDAGHMRGTDVDSSECVFEEMLTENFFTIYYSVMYCRKRWCLSLQRKHSSKIFNKRAEVVRDIAFMTEMVQQRASLSSSCYSSDDMPSS